MFITTSSSPIILSLHCHRQVWKEQYLLCNFISHALSFATEKTYGALRSFCGFFILDQATCQKCRNCSFLFILRLHVKQFRFPIPLRNAIVTAGLVQLGCLEESPHTHCLQCVSDQPSYTLEISWKSDKVLV